MLPYWFKPLMILLCTEVEVAGIKHGVERDGELTSQ
jgi:hypothetical protein